MSRSTIDILDPTIAVFVGELRKKVDTEIADRRIRLGNGGALSFPDYAHEVGEIRALGLTGEWIDDILKRMRESP